MESELWKKFGGKSARVDNLLKVMGFGPDGVPPERKEICPACGKKELVVRERHPDTDMNYMEQRCLSCKYSKEV